MHIEQAIKQLEEQLNGEIVPSCHEKEEGLLLLSLWKVLQRISEQHPSLLLLPCVERGDWKCEAILLSHGGIYVFHLLPIHMIGIEIQFSGIKVQLDNAPIHEVFYPLGKSGLFLEGLQHELYGSSLSVYEFYIASEQQADLCFTHHGHLMISISQLEDLFSRYEFRPDPSRERTQKEVYQNLTNGKSGEVLERETGEITRFVMDKKHKDSFDQPISQSLPPRQSRKKKHSHSWVHRFFK